MMIGYFRIKQAMEYCGVSERTLYNWMKHEGLRHSKVGSILFIKLEWLDEFIEEHERSRESAEQQIDEIANGVVNSM